MGMSIGLFIITLCLHLLCLWRARRAHFQGVFFMTKTAPFHDDPKAFRELLEQWVSKHSHLQWHLKSGKQLVVEEKTRFTNYGFFYSFTLTPEDSGLLVHIGVEAKLVPMPPSQLSSWPPMDIKDAS